MVEIRSMIDNSYLESLLKFLGIKRQHWQAAVEQTALASVRAFCFLHTVCFGGLPEAERPDLGLEHSTSTSDEDVEGKLTKQKACRGHANMAQDCMDSDSSSSG